jgi:CubicO group peptidase (beta-lactamase class C family)
MHRACVGLALAFFLVFAVSAHTEAGAARAEPLVPRAKPAAPDPLHAYLEACESFGFSGSVLVARGGKKILSEGFGLADRDKKIKNDPATCFEIASATKSFTAVAIFQLAQAGKLALDDSSRSTSPACRRRWRTSRSAIS